MPEECASTLFEKHSTENDPVPFICLISYAKQVLSADNLSLQKYNCLMFRLSELLFLYFI